MSFPFLKKAAGFAAAAMVAVLVWRWALPVALPFLLGALVALAAEPLVRPLSCRMRRSLASGIGITLALAALLCLMILLTALLLRQLTGFSHRMPQVVNTLRSGLQDLQGTLCTLSDRAPESVRPLLQRTMDSLFTDGGAVLDQALERLPAAASALSRSSWVMPRASAFCMRS